MSLGRVGDVTGRVHFSIVFETSRAMGAGARNRDPSMRAITASLTSLTDVTVGGGAGSSIRSTLSRAIASTTAVITAAVTAGPRPPPIATTVPGIAAARAVISGLSASAGRHWTSAFTGPVWGRWATFRAGTIDPDAASRTPSRATWPSQRTLAPTPVRPWPAPTATSQPSASFIGMASASARMPPGSGTPGWICQPTGGPPISSRRVDNSSCDSGVAPRPDAQTTTCPDAHDA